MDPATSAARLAVIMPKLTKGEEDLIALRVRYVFSRVNDIHYGPALLPAHLDTHRRLAVPLGIVEKIVDQAAKQTRISFDHYRLPLDAAILVTCTILNGER